MNEKPRYSTKHPYAAIEHRVIDSPAYADLSFSARALLLILARQLTKDNNGRLQAAFTYVKGYGITSKRTLSRSLMELISHGMIYRTRTGGYQQGASQYAVTWLPIKHGEGLFLAGFRSCAWREWSPDKKTPPAKIPPARFISGTRTLPAGAINEPGYPRKNEHTELMPCSGAAADRSGGMRAIAAYLCKHDGGKVIELRPRLSIPEGQAA